MLHHREITLLLLVAKGICCLELPLLPLQEHLIIVIKSVVNFHIKVNHKVNSINQFKQEKWQITTEVI